MDHPVRLSVLPAAVACLASLALAAAAFATSAPVKWLKVLPGAGTVQFGKPVLADLDGDGKLWVIVGTVSTNGQGAVYVLNPHDGSVRTGTPGWPQVTAGAIASSPAVGDLLGDGKREIVVTSGDNNATNLMTPATVTAFRPDGSILWRKTPQAASGLSNHMVSSPAIADLNGDGKEDVVFGSFSQYVYALDGPTGNPLPGWPVFVRDAVWSSPAIADLAGDGKLEIVIGSEAHAEGTPINSPNGGALWVFRSNGTNFPGFPQYTQPESVDSSPAVGDIDGDGCPEIVVGTTSTTDSGGKVINAFHGDGTPVTGWPVALSGHTFTSPMLVDLNGDGVLDVVENDDTGTLYGLRGDGSMIFHMLPKVAADGRPAVVAYEMAAAQIGSNNPVLVLGGVGFDVTLVSKTGVQLSDDGSHGAGMLTYTTTNEVQSPAVGDLENSGALSIVAASGTNDGSNDVHVIAWNAGSVGALQWPMFRHDRKHGAWASPSHACPRVPKPLSFYTLAPCRISDSRGPGNLTYGGPPLVNGEMRTLTVTGSWSPSGGCGIPTTAKAVSLNVTITGPSASGFVSLFPGGDGYPGTSTVNFISSQTLANNLVVPLSFEGLGHVTMLAALPGGGQVNVLVDTNGYFQ